MQKNRRIKPWRDPDQNDMSYTRFSPYSDRYTCPRGGKGELNFNQSEFVLNGQYTYAQVKNLREHF